MFEGDIQNALEWFRSNRMVPNPNKFQVMFLGTQSKVDNCLNINNQVCKPSTSVKLLGVTIDWKLNFNIHVNEICTKAILKSQALIRLRSKLSLSQKLSLCYSYIVLATVLSYGHFRGKVAIR